MKYLIIVEKNETGYSAFSPDLNGVVAAGKSRKEVEKLMHEAIEFHIEGLKAEGEEIPEPSSYSTYLDVEAANKKHPTKILQSICMKHLGEFSPAKELIAERRREKD